MTAATSDPREGAWRTLVRGLRLSPEFREGLGLTLLAAFVATGGRVLVPVAVQQTIDRALQVEGGPYPMRALALAGVILVAVLITGVAGYAMNYRLARTTETALSALRTRAFRHVHDLSMLHHTTEHRGALVSRVTSDIDQISRFMQWGGLVLVVSLAQLVLTLAIMAWYSWELTLLVLGIIAPLGLILRVFQQRLSRAYDTVRERTADMLTAFSESVMGASVIRAYNVEGRTNRRVHEAVQRHFAATYRAGKIAAFMFSGGEVFAAAAAAATVVVGVVYGVGGGLTLGQLIAFLFLVNLFVDPLQIATEILDQAQTAVAGWRRVLDILDTPADVADPEDGRAIPPGPIGVRFEAVDFAYPGLGQDQAPTKVLHDIDVDIAPRSRVAIVGETGSGKTTFAKLLARLMDPTSGRIQVNDVPLEQVSFASLRGRIIMVPQDDFLFDAAIEANVRYGNPEVDREQIRLAFIELGLAEWLESLPHGLDTRAGERGTNLSAGEQQLVALARAWVANPDLLLLDEATSAVDPATEVRLQRAIEGLTRGRTAVSIAHRLSTAEKADTVVVFDGGRIVQRGTHAELVQRPGVYARLHESWTRRGAVA